MPPYWGDDIRSPQQRAVWDKYLKDSHEFDVATWEQKRRLEAEAARAASIKKLLSYRALLYSDIQFSFGGASAGSHPEIRKQRMEAQENYRQELNLLSLDMLRELLDNEERENLVREDQARFFNLPEAVADNSYWSPLPFWTRDEAIALMLGRNPKVVTWESVADLVPISHFAQRFSHLREMIVRAISAGVLSEPIAPPVCIEWATSNGLDLPSGLLEACKVHHQRLRSWRDLNEEVGHLRSALVEKSQELQSLEQQKAKTDKPLGMRERDNLLTIVLPGAMRAYGYNPAQRSATANWIVRDAEALGLTISDDTVRRHLNQAAEMLKPDWKERWDAHVRSTKRAIAGK